MLLRFKNHIDKTLPFFKKQKVIIACSGGLDSMVLTSLCNQLHIDIALAHCNFKLRGDESDVDELFVENNATRLDIPFFSTSFDTEYYAREQKVSIQMAARALRYEWFETLIKDTKYTWVATAHHADDSLETFLINLSRGTGIDGLTGIPAINGVYVRPLLPFSREEIHQYATTNKLQWREDSSNASTKYIRNKLRHDVIPQLKEIQPQLLQNVEKTLGYLQQSSAFIKDQVAGIREQLFVYEDTGVIKVPVAPFLLMENPKSYLYFLFKEYGFTSWDDVVGMLSAQSGKQLFSETHRLLKNRDNLLITPIQRQVANKTYQIPEEERVVMIDSGTLRFEEVKEIDKTALNTVYLDKEKLKYPLIVRKWKEGDYFYPLGMRGKKKLSKYFKDEKLSLIEKEHVWLLCSGSEEEIVWVVNYRADHRFRITSQTKQILKITIRL
ncbi:tRNA lysidine(34) synthetase TilS [Aquimarina hainanensis]|uniref:tRNA(Ile)-lysidine synthase n=1 Tax=Aquimarina hainanensis TaxID=1578017 RepID=A0ABW5NDB2_9FLAO